MPSFCKMVFTVVQWEDENSVSVVHEKDIILDGEQQPEENMKVQVLIKEKNARPALHKATVLKVFGECSSSS